MSKTVKIISFILCFTLFISVFSFSINTFAVADGTMGFVNGDGVNMREEANTTSNTVAQLSRVNVIIHEAVAGQAVMEGYDTWYRVSTLDGSYTGYIYGTYIKIHSNQDLSADFEQQLLFFPESYREPLRQLKRMYPNWSFIADPVTISFDQAVNQEYSVINRKQVHMTYEGGNTVWRDPRCLVGDTWQVSNGDWVGASREAIAYFMDPRNFLNPNDIYVFMMQSYNDEAQTEESRNQIIAVLRTIINGTFLANGYDVNGDGVTDATEVDAYIWDIMEAAKVSKVNPYILASTIILEQGTKGTSDLISGTHPVYGGYYNFFNFGASGATEAEVISSGLDYAANKVIPPWNSRRASIVGGAEKYNAGYISVGQDTYYYKDFNLVNLNFNHQYAQSVYDAAVSAVRLRKAYIDNTGAALIFKIPVFTEIPTAVAAKPGTQGSGSSGVEFVYRYGDVNGDNQINAIDLASVKKHILSVSAISGVGLISADVNHDGAINALDLAAIKKHILGVQKIS